MIRDIDDPIAQATRAEPVWPRYFRLAAVFLLVLTGVRLVIMASGFPNLSGDEAHYWEWSRRLDWCYYSKPPGVAYLIRAGTLLFGNTELGVRFMAAPLSVLSSVVIYLLGTRLYDRKVGLTAAVLFQAVPLFSAFGIAMTPDTGLIFFWLLSLLFLHRAWSDGAPRDWLLLGCSLGLGLLFKYAIAFLYLPAALLLLTTAQGRQRLRTPWPYLALGLSLLFFLPVVVWNSQHNWVMFRHDLGHTNVREGLVFSLGSLLEFIGGQLGAVTPILCVLMLVLLIKHRRQDPFCFWVTIPILAGFLLKSMQGKIQANWPLVAWLAGFISLANYLIHRYPAAGTHIKRLVVIGLIIPAVGTVLLHLPFLTLNIPLPPEANPFKKIIGWEQLGNEVTSLVDNMEPPVFVFSDHYMTASSLAFYVEGQPQTYCVNLGRRMNQYDIWGGWEDLRGQNAVYVSENKMPEKLAKAFARIEAHPIDIHDYFGNTIKTFMAYRCYDFKEWTQPSETTY